MIKQTNTNCREKKDILRNKMNQRKKKLQMRRSIETIDKVYYKYTRTLDLLNTA